MCSLVQSFEFSTVLILEIFSEKNLPKGFERSKLSEQSDRGEDSFLCNIRLILVQSFLGLFLLSLTNLEYQSFFDSEIRQLYRWTLKDCPCFSETDLVRHHVCSKCLVVSFAWMISSGILGTGCRVGRNLVFIGTWRFHQIG